MSTLRVRLLAQAAGLSVALTLLSACGGQPNPAVGSSSANSLLGAAQGLAEPTAVPTAGVPATEEPTTEPTEQPAVTNLMADTGAVQAAPQAPALPLGPAFDVDELDVIARINEYRVQNGLWPLAPNDQLRTLAHSQANFVAGLPEIPYEDMHAGATGEDAITRAGRAGWPSYNNPQQIAIAENAYAGATIPAAMDWWKGSDLHNRTMLNVGFREVGAAIVDAHGTKLIYIVFGSRPGVVPTLYDPNSGVVYVSSERYKWSAGGAWLQDVTQVSVTQGGAAPTWSPYALTVPAPADANAAFHVSLTDGTTTLEADLNPRADIAWLPSTTHLNPAVAGQTPPPQAPPALPPNVVVTYNDKSLEITVIGSAPVNLVGFDIAGGGKLIASIHWEAPGLLVSPLNATPPGACLQVWRYDILVEYVRPAECQHIDEVIYLMPLELFWLTGDFELRYKGVVLTTCKMGAGRCEALVP